MNIKLENLYEKYNKLVFNMALSLCNNHEDVEIVVSNTFKHLLKINDDDNHIELNNLKVIKIIISLSKDTLNNANFKSIDITPTPTIFKLLCFKNSFSNFCLEQKIEIEQSKQIIKTEFAFLKSKNKKYDHADYVNRY